MLGVSQKKYLFKLKTFFTEDRISISDFALIFVKYINLLYINYIFFKNNCVKE